jgi:hypothetical protein
MRVAIRTLALAAALVAVSAASAQTAAPPGFSRSTMPTLNSARMSMASSISNLFGLRNLLPTFRDTGPYSSGVPDAVQSGIPDPSNSANYLKGFGFKRLGQ